MMKFIQKYDKTPTYYIALNYNVTCTSLKTKKILKIHPMIVNRCTTTTSDAVRSNVFNRHTVNTVAKTTVTSYSLTPSFCAFVR